MVLLATIDAACPGSSVANEESAADNFLVPLATDKEKPIVLDYQAYLRECMYADTAQKMQDKGYSYEVAEEKWRALWERAFPQDRYIAIFVTEFTAAVVDDRFNSLLGLSRKDDSGEGVLCSYDVKGNRYLMPNASQNLPIKVCGEVREKNALLLEEALNSSGFGKKEWERFFYANNMWINPSVRRIWVTSWDDISKRWNDLLEARDAKKVREQIDTIQKSERFDAAGGETWRENIEKWWKANATNVAPRLKIYNHSNEARGVRLRWELVRGYSLVVPEFTLAERDVREISAPFQDIGPTGKITAVVQYFIPKCDCCGYQEDVFDFVGPFAEDRIFLIEKSEALWENRDRATLIVSINNSDERKLAVKFMPENQTYTSAMIKKEGMDVWMCNVPAHTNGMVMVYEEKAGTNSTLLKELTIDGTELHRGATVTNVVTLPAVVRLPELIRQNELIFEGEKKENAILEVKIEKGYAVFNGDKAKFSNPEVLDGYEICKPGNVNIPMKATLVSGDDPPAVLQPLAARILHPRGESAWTGNATKVLDETPETTNSFIPIPQQTFYLGSWEECEVIISKEPQTKSRGEILEELRKVKPTWIGTINSYVKDNNLLPKLTITNQTTNTIIVASDDGKLNMKLKGSESAICQIDNWTPKEIFVYDERYDKHEYEDNDIKGKIQNWPQAWGDNEQYTITTDNLILGPNPFIILSWPADLTNAEITVHGKNYSAASTNSITIPIPRKEKLQDLSASFVGRDSCIHKLKKGCLNIPESFRYHGLKHGEHAEFKIGMNDLDELEYVDSPDEEEGDDGGELTPDEENLRGFIVRALGTIDDDGKNKAEKSGAKGNIRKTSPSNNNTHARTMQGLINKCGGDREKALEKLGFSTEAIEKICGIWDN